MRVSISLLPQYAFNTCCSFINQKDNFTLPLPSLWLSRQNLVCDGRIQVVDAFCCAYCFLLAQRLGDVRGVESTCVEGGGRMREKGGTTTEMWFTRIWVLIYIRRSRRVVPSSCFEMTRHLLNDLHHYGFCLYVLVMLLMFVVVQCLGRCRCLDASSPCPSRDPDSQPLWIHTVYPPSNPVLYVRNAALRFSTCHDNRQEER
jgi:hypothetical protein